MRSGLCLLTTTDYIRTAFSLANAASRDIFSLLLSLWPYLAILALFALFILVNGGVVLGTIPPSP